MMRQKISSWSRRWFVTWDILGNPNEVEYFDEVLQKIVTDIRANGMVRELSA